jgi:hypothetical protein
MPNNLSSSDYIDIACFYLEYSMQIGSNIYPFSIVIGLIRMIMINV